MSIFKDSDIFVQTTQNFTEIPTLVNIHNDLLIILYKPLEM